MIRDLTIEYRKNPIGIDEKPRVSWKLESEKQDVVQTNYQIQVVSGGRLMWDSGRVKSDQSVLVPYKGAALKEMTVYQVQVSVWDNYGELGQVTGNFETGLMREENWNAKWITHTLPAEDCMSGICPQLFSGQTSEESKAVCDCLWCI